MSSTSRRACWVTTPPPIRPKRCWPRWAPASPSAFTPTPWLAASPCFKLELELEGDLNITAVWGVGDISEKPVGFTDVRVKVTFEADRPRAELEELIAHSQVWSPVANTLTRPVNLEVALA